MRRGFIALMLAFGAITSAPAQVSVGIGVNLPGVSIGINFPTYPQLVRVPSYPVYYAPGLGANYFFYDGMYWVYQSDSWYASSWYNGPWYVVEPAYVPVYVLRVPVRYYRQPPPYFGGWRRDAPPRWGEHWGRDWEQQRPGWDRWNRGAAPPPAPLPVYQRRYAGDRYPPPDQQRNLQGQNYRYQPRDAVVRERFQPPAPPRAQGPAGGPGRPPPQREPRSVPLPPGSPGGPGIARPSPSPTNRAPQETRAPSRPVEPRAPQTRPAPPERVQRPAPPERAQRPAQQQPQPAAARPEPNVQRPGNPPPPQRAGREQGQPPSQGGRERGEGRGPDRRD